jgi:kynureninase
LAGVVSDWREPSVIRIAPTPLYNSYVDVYEFVSRLASLSSK